MQTHRHIGRQGPGSGGPDRYRNFASVTCAENGVECARVDRQKRHVDGGRAFVLVFHLRFRQSRATIHTPVHWLEALVQVAVVHNTRERSNDVRLELEIHGQVGIGPVANHTHAHEIRALCIYLPRCVLPTLLSKLSRRYFDTWLADLLFHVEFYRQAVTIPPRHVGCIEAVQRFGLHNDVFQNLINRVPQM